jgi:16S rRNA processing protein RimM
MPYSSDQTKIELGKITSAVGLKGEVKVMLYSDDPRNLRQGVTLYVEKNAAESELVIEAVREQKGAPVVKLAQVDDRNAAELLRGSVIYISEDDLAELAPGEHYVRDLIGLDVFDRTGGKVIGKVADVITNTAQGIYSVRRDDGSEVLIPSVPEFIKEIDVEGGRIEVELIPGFYED